MNLEELTKSATPGDWRAVPLAGGHQAAIVSDAPGQGGHIALVYDPNNGDAALIAHSKNVLPKVVAALELCEQALKDHVQYEGEDGSLEGDGFRAAQKALHEAKYPQ